MTVDVMKVSNGFIVRRNGNYQTVLLSHDVIVIENNSAHLSQRIGEAVLKLMEDNNEQK